MCIIDIVKNWQSSANDLFLHLTVTQKQYYKTWIINKLNEGTPVE